MIAPMAKIQIAALESDREALLQFLQEEEVVHVSETPVDIPGPAGGDESKTAYRLARVQFVLEFITRIRSELHMEEKRSFKNMFAGKPAAALAELEKTFQDLHIDELIEQTVHLNDQLLEAQSRINALTEEESSVAPWKTLTVTGADQATSQPVVYTLIEAALRDEEAFRTTLADIPTAMWQEVDRDSSNKVPVVRGEVVVHQKDEATLRAFLQQINAKEITLPLATAETVADKLKAIQKEIQQEEKRYKEILRESKKVVKKERELQFAYDALLHKQEREVVERHVACSPFTLVLTGWVPKNWVQALRTRIEQTFPSAALEEIMISEGDKPPVALHNSRFMQPFEAVTNIYGKPAYNELDPSGALSLFFLISFGLALTDAGYGLVMMAGTFAADRFFRLKREMRKMVRLLFYAGFFTFILGALTGGWFGIDLAALADGPVKKFLLDIQLINPIQDPLKLLGVAFAIGIVQLLFAWVMRARHNWNMNQKMNIILDDIPWITMVILILAWAGAKLGIVFVEAVLVLKWAAVINAIFLVLTQGRSFKNPFLKLGAGAISLYGLISFMSDTLSYSRLLALGLATGIIGLVVNLIASMVSSSIPVVGFVLAGVVLLVGHVFNLGINALGAFIHSGRLQFVEFFPKFIEGGGVPYKPLGRVSKYVDNPKEFEINS
ncbi:MAG: V-type ATP synthase subunit I [Candidatus Andersenbacteria bacterium]